MRNLITVLLIGDEEKLDKFIANNNIMFANVLNESAALVGIKQPIANMISP